MKKCYKIDVSDFNILDCYGFKRDCDQPAHIKNVLRLDDIYRVRYPFYMEKVQRLQYMNFRTRENKDISDRERDSYGVPDYFLVCELEENGRFEYAEVLTGLSFIIPGEVYKSYDAGKQELSVDEAVSLFDDKYIEKVGSLFHLAYDREKKDVVKAELIKKIK